MARRFCSRPTDKRRALGKWLVSTRAWISTSKGRVPSCVTITQEPGTWLSCCDRNRADGFDTPFKPFSVMANTPSSLTAPKRFLMARTRRKLEWASPSKYSTVSTMCSSTRGPASAPSFVTWPTRMMVTPVCLAARVSCAAHSRTCATEPGAELSASEYTVWIESITTTSGFKSCKVDRIFSSWISACNLSSLASMTRRLARRAICAPDSSPLTYSTRLWCDMFASACSSSVDLPMPGSPPISTTAPATRPPPSTRSNSSRPVGWRGVSRASISDRLRTGLEDASGA
ncbi:hypothetical protein D3C72_1434520 [compost metagenome]